LIVGHHFDAIPISWASDSLNPDNEVNPVTPVHVARLLDHLNRCGVTLLPKSTRRVNVGIVSNAEASQLGMAMGRSAVDAGSAIKASLTAAVAEKTSASRDALAAAAERSLTASVALETQRPASPGLSNSSTQVFAPLTGPYPGPSLPLAQRTHQLAELANEVAGCVRCEVLACTRKTTVFGAGNPAARVCFFGEAPGEEEDATGRPFVGRSGMLLTKMIEACTLSRDEVYILNTVKCRPPGNRNPDPQERDHCREYFESQLRIIRPQYIVCLGLVAVQTLLETTQSIGKLRSRFHSYHDSKVLATYHPAYLLRNPDAKKEAWADLKLLMSDMGIDLSKR